MNLDGNSVQGFTDGQDAMKQMIFRTLNTQSGTSISSIPGGMELKPLTFMGNRSPMSARNWNAESPKHWKLTPGSSVLVILNMTFL